MAYRRGTSVGMIHSIDITAIQQQAGVTIPIDQIRALLAPFAAQLWSIYESYKDVKLFSFKWRFWGIPISITPTLSQIRPVFEWLLGPEPIPGT
ncbi:MAG: hypothetical protein ACRDQZ_04750 [Mycobacteriales bacterium]